MKEKIIIVLRWICILPGACLAFIATTAIYSLGSTFFFGNDSMYVRYFVPNISSLIAGVAFFMAAMAITPSYRKKVAFSLLIIVSILFGVVLLNCLREEDYFGIITQACTLTGYIIGYSVVMKSENNVVTL